METDEKAAVASALDAAGYSRERMDPEAGDQFFLHLADLREALDAHASKEPIAVLDFGCGGSPYRGLFPRATYHRADFSPMPGLDFQVTNEGLMPEAPSSAYDLVLSTQVLEHVIAPERYLAEALRVLKPGGRLVLSTHGTFPDHGCPHDYWRWTSDGLRVLLERAGFAQVQVQRLTCGARALFLLVDAAVYSNPSVSAGLSGVMLRRLYLPIRAALHRVVDARLSALAVLPGGSGESSLCIGLLASAVKA